MLGALFLTSAIFAFAQALYFDNRAACSSHWDYPNTFQCGVSLICISITQYHNNQTDCCDPSKPVCNDYSDEAQYFNNGPARNTLEKPGVNCYGHPAYPDTMQCAVTKRCISFAQYRDGKFDCCAPNATSCDEDQSDENRIDPPGQCPASPEYTINNVQMSSQCAQTKRCLSQMSQPNGKCDCCGPNYDCSNCTDQSDEDACRPTDWFKRFSCAGTCRDISQLNDTVFDCPYECVETGPGIRDECRTALQTQQTKSANDWCEKLIAKNTAYFSCMAMGTTGLIQVCVEPARVRDGRYECEDGNDESSTLNPDCSAAEKAQNCADNASQCIKINNDATQIDCRCSGPQSCFKNSQARKKK